MKPLVDALGGIRVYRSYSLDRVRAPSVDNGRNFLNGDGTNLWSVLRNWHGSPTRYRGQFEWVINTIQKAFPGIVNKIEFDQGNAYLFGAHATDPADGLPPERAADGVLTGLLHLTAIAGTTDGGIVAFDEMENQLHPHAIRIILAAMREQADLRDLTVILTTHSPVVMNAFRDHLHQFYVLELANQGQPRRLDELHDEDWLAQSFLGELYENLEFGAPTRS